MDLSVPRGPAGQHRGRNIAHKEWRRMIHRDWGFSQTPHGATEDVGGAIAHRAGRLHTPGRNPLTLKEPEEDVWN